jgi:hypothetical protein
MSKYRFVGTIVRIEPNGFAIVEFEPPAPSANNYGVFSTITGSTMPGSSLRFSTLTAGSRVSGEAEIDADPRKMAAIKTMQQFNN